MIRLALAATLLAGALQAPAAAQAIEDRTVHERFACLQRERALEELPPKTVDNQNSGLLRFKLRFTHPDRPPQIERIAGAAEDDMERVALRYLEGYRVPCLHEGDHPIEVVQEFNFSRWGAEPAVPLAGPPSKLRFDLPKEGPRFTRFESPGYGPAMAELTFVEGRDEPQVRFIVSSVGRDGEQALARWAKKIRLIDRDGQAGPIVVRQPFKVLDPVTGGGSYRLSKDEFSLLEFLRMVKNLDEHRVDVNLDSMACPFAVRLSLRQPYEANEVRELDSRDPNRAFLLHWLGKLQLRFADLAQQKALFDSEVRIAIPCGRLDLTALKAPAATSGAS